MVGIVVVSHSPELAAAAVRLAAEMLHGSTVALAVAAGTVDGATGTDAARIAAAIREVASGDGVLVVTDLGSAVLSSELALELLADSGGVEDEIRLSTGPFVEGLLAAAVTASTGAALDRVAGQADSALEPKRRLLGGAAT